MNELETCLGTESREITKTLLRTFQCRRKQRGKMGERNEREKVGSGICLSFPAVRINTFVNPIVAWCKVMR